MVSCKTQNLHDVICLGCNMNVLIKNVKNAMSVSFGRICLHLIFIPYLNRESYFRKYEKLP